MKDEVFICCVPSLEERQAEYIASDAAQEYCSKFLQKNFGKLVGKVKLKHKHHSEFNFWKTYYFIFKWRSK